MKTLWLLALVACTATAGALAAPIEVACAIRMYERDGRRAISEPFTRVVAFDEEQQTMQTDTYPLKRVRITSFAAVGFMVSDRGELDRAAGQLTVTIDEPENRNDGAVLYRGNCATVAQRKF